MKNNISFTSILNKKGKSPQIQTSSRLKLAEYMEQFEMHPEEEYILSYNSKFMMSQRSKHSSVSLFASKGQSDGKEMMFDSWIQRQTHINNKENNRLEAQERKGFGSELQRKGENKQKLIESKNIEQGQGNSQTFSQKYKGKNLLDINLRNHEKEAQQNQNYIRSNSQKIVVNEDNLQAQEEYYNVPQVEQIRSPKTLKEFPRKQYEDEEQEERNSLQPQTRQESKAKQPIIKISQAQGFNPQTEQSKKKRKVEQFVARTKQTIIGDIQEMAKKIIRQKQISEIQEQQLLIEDSDKKYTTYQKPHLQKKPSSEKATPLVFDQKDIQKDEEDRIRRQDAKNKLSEYFKQLNQNKNPQEKDSNREKVVKKQQQFESDVGYSFSHNLTCNQDEHMHERSSNRIDSNQTEMSLGNIQEIRSQLPSEGTDRKMQDSQQLHFRRKYLKMPSIEIDANIKNIQSVNYDLENDVMQESKAIAFGVEHKIYSPREIRREHEIRQLEIEKEQIQKLSQHHPNNSKQFNAYFNQSYAQDIKSSCEDNRSMENTFKQQGNQNKYAIPKSIEKVEEVPQKLSEEINYVKTQMVVDLSSKIVESQHAKVQNNNHFKLKSPQRPQKTQYREESTQNTEQIGENNTFKITNQVKSSPKDSKFNDNLLTKQVNRFSTDKMQQSPYQTIKGVESIAFVPVKVEENIAPFKNIQTITHQPIPAAQYFADRSPLKSSKSQPTEPITQTYQSNFTTNTFSTSYASKYTPNYSNSPSYATPSTYTTPTTYTAPSTYTPTTTTLTTPTTFTAPNTFNPSTYVSTFAKPTSPSETNFNINTTQRIITSPSTNYQVSYEKKIENINQFKSPVYTPTDAVETNKKQILNLAPKNQRNDFLQKLEIKESINVDEKTSFGTRKLNVIETTKIEKEPLIKFSKTIVTTDLKPNFNMNFPLKSSIRNSIKESEKGVNDSGADFKFQLDDF